MAKTNAQRQAAFRQRQRESNATVTPAICAATVTRDAEGGTIQKDGHTYYAFSDGRIFAVVCCQQPGCTLCSGSRDLVAPPPGASRPADQTA
jgi:hypothetical protein